MHSNWRDCAEWRSQGLPLSTTSNEACKLYDATITQYVSYTNDVTLGGMSATVQGMMHADPDCLMGHVVANEFTLFGCSSKTRHDPSVRSSIDHMVKLADKTNATPRERMHMKAVQHLAEGLLADATQTWMDILIEHPTDLHAIKLAFDGCFALGWQRQMRDTLSRVLPFCNPQMPLYGYLLGMHAHGLQETLMYDEGEKVARKGMEIAPLDIMAVHALCHILLMNGRHKEGFAHLEDTVKNWEKSDMLRCHIYWHWTLHHLEQGDFQSALDMYDTHIHPEARKPNNVWDLADGASFLKRLEFEGVNIGNRWKELMCNAEVHVDDHSTCFGDAHVMITCLAANETQTAQKLLDVMKNYATSGKNRDHAVVQEVGIPLCEGFQAYEAGDFDRTVDLLYPIKYKIVDIGGSNAQRDVFDLYLVNAALRSPRKAHVNLARELSMERKALNENSPLTDRLLARCMASHGD